MPREAKLVHFGLCKNFLPEIVDPVAFTVLEGKPRKACVSGCAATTLAGLTAVGHALEGRLFASRQSCVEDHTRYLLRLVSVSPVPPEITFTPVPPEITFTPFFF
jgi:hypothetical protein